MRKLHALLALLVVLAAPALAGAQPSIAVLGLEPIEVPEDVAAQVTQALRGRATQAGMRVVTAKPLVEMKLVFGCLDEALACMAQIGSSLGAQKLLFGAVRKSRGGYSVTLKLVDVGRVRLEKEQTFQLLKAEARGLTLKERVAEWFTTALGLKATGTLNIIPSVAGARVFVDDVVIGTASGIAPVVAGDLRPGSHEVTVTAQGYKRFTASLRVLAGETLTINAQLEREADALTPGGPTGPTGPIGIGGPTGPSVESPGRASRIAFWSTASAAVVTFAVAGYAAWKVGDLGDAKLAAMQQGCAVDPNGPACLRYIPSCGDSTAGEACRYNVPGNDACAAAGLKDPLTGLPRNSKVADACSDGKSWATSTWVLFPIAGAFTAAAGYFFWNGYLTGKPADKEKPGTTAWRLRLEPVVGPGLTAVSASLQF